MTVQIHRHLELELLQSRLRMSQPAHSSTCSVPSSVNLISANATVDLTYTVTTQATTPTGQYSAIITAIYAPGGAPPGFDLRRSLGGRTRTIA